MAQVEVAVTIADLEPVAGFIAEVCAADAAIRAMSAEEASALPDTAARGISILQSATGRLRAHLPGRFADPGLPGEPEDGAPW